MSTTRTRSRVLHLLPLAERLGRSRRNTLYFDGPIAIHGSKSVPTYPASHGCVRVTGVRTTSSHG